MKTKEDYQGQFEKRWRVPAVPDQQGVNDKFLDDGDIRGSFFRRKTPDDVRTRYGRKFDAKYGWLIKKCLDFIGQIDKELCRLRDELERLCAKDKSTDETVPDAVMAPTRRLTGVEWIQLALYITMMLLLVALGCLVVRNAVQIVDPKAYGTLLMAGYFAIPLISPVLFEVLEGYCTTDSGKRRYAISITILAILGCSLWIVQFALSSSTSFVGSATSFGWSERNSEASWLELTILWLDKFALYIQLTSEGLLLAVLWLNAKRILRLRWGLAAAINREKKIIDERKADLIAQIEGLIDHRAALSSALDALQDRRHELCDIAAQMLEDALKPLQGLRRAQ